VDDPVIRVVFCFTFTFVAYIPHTRISLDGVTFFVLVTNGGVFMGIIVASSHAWHNFFKTNKKKVRGLVKFSLFSKDTLTEHTSRRGNILERNSFKLLFLKKT